MGLTVNLVWTTIWSGVYNLSMFLVSYEILECYVVFAQCVIWIMRKRRIGNWVIRNVVTIEI